MSKKNDKKVTKKEVKKSVKKVDKVKKNNGIKEKIITLVKNKQFIVNLFVILVDVGLIIYTARENIANYVNISGKDIFVGETKNLFFGRNYITLIITLFVYLYGLIINKVLFKEKFSVKKCLILLISILLFNMVLFYIFTNRVY